ncbi:hypothetical protein AL714_17975 [Clostridium botulinum]|nr:hypothetical protein AL714_17975 [Clostridium botulinum]
MSINVFFIINVIVLIICFYVKNKNFDNSLSSKFLYILKKEYPLIIALIIIYIFCNYIYLVDKKIAVNYNSGINLLNVQGKKISKFMKYVFGNIFSSIFEKEIFKIIIIGFFSTKILLNDGLFERFKYFINQIKEINFKDLSIKTQEAKNEIKNIEAKQPEFNSDIVIKEEKSRIKKEIIAIMIDNVEIVKYLDKFINGYQEYLIIPKNAIPQKVSLSALEKLFVVDIGINSIKLLGIKPELFSLVNETFQELLTKGIIYCRNNSK